MKHITAYYTVNGTKSARMECSYLTNDLKKLRDKLKDEQQDIQIHLEYRTIPEKHLTNYLESLSLHPKII